MGNTILIAEDKPTELRILSRYFSAGGFAVYPAASCAEAIKLARQHHPDCFLLDYHLDGDKTADEICACIRSNEYIRKNPVVILSGDPEIAIQSCTVCKADYFVQKGRPYSEVMTLVKKLLYRTEWNRGVLKRGDLTLEASTLRLLRPSYPPIQLSPEQFRFFCIIFENSPDFVGEEQACAHVYGSYTLENRSALWSLAYRLRGKLGLQLARRIKNRRNCGWIYVQPRVRTGRTRPRSLEKI